jgi:chromodomain-helicase-DNA-binding protein 4
LICLDPEMTEAPEGDWICPHCEENPVQTQKEPEEQKKANMEYCRACLEGGSLICCDTCVSSFHAYCLDPPLTKLPPTDENWSCPRCLAPQPGNKSDKFPSKTSFTEKKPEKFITWRWKYFEYPDPVAEEDLLKEGESAEDIDPERNARLTLRPPRKLEPRRERELFVKWKYMSYWHCEWVREYILEIYFPQTVRMYWRKFDPEHPPEIEDLPTKHTENDPLDLEHRFYRYGIKPEWLQIHRIVNHHPYMKNQFDYLIKWRELVYEQATWETDEYTIPNLDEAISKYWIHRERMIGESIPKSVIKRINAYRAQQNLPPLEEEKKKHKEGKTPKTDPKKKYDHQPDYVTETGGKLHPYQLEGINWLRYSWSQGTDVILADEMGLGKTIQSMVFLYSLVKEGHSKGPFLVAAPLSTLINWEREAEYWVRHNFGSFLKPKNEKSQILALFVFLALF